MNRHVSRGAVLSKLDWAYTLYTWGSDEQAKRMLFSVIRDLGLDERGGNVKENK